MTGGADLKVRRFERMDFVADATFTVAPEHRDQVRFSSSAPQSLSTFDLDVTLLDIGSGGVGIRSPLPLPRQLHGCIRILEPTSGRTDREGTRRVMLEAPVRLCRSEAIPGLETYMVGAAFNGDDAEVQRLLEAFFSDLHDVLPRVTADAEQEAGHA